MLIPYMRKSSGEDETLSRERQSRAIRAWAELNGVGLAEEIWEPRVSGRKSWRERGLGAAVAAVERGEAAGIICEEQSRLSRENGLATAEVWDALERAGARLVCTAEGVDTAQGDHELSFAIRAALAREQWKQYKRRSDDVKRNRVEAGVFIGPAPTGYVKGAGGRLEIDPELAPVVRELFELRAEGKSWGDLLKHADARTGHTWTQPGVAGIIRNRAYLGDLVYGDLANEGAHDPIIDAPLWEAAQRRGKPPARSGRKTDKWLLSGLVACGSCGHSMVVWRGAARRKKKGGGFYEQRVHRRYRCTNRSCAARVSVKAPGIEEWAVETVWRLLGSRTRDDREAPDMEPLVTAVETTRRRLEQASTPESQDALGDGWAAYVRERRLEHEAALAALGDARANGAPRGDVTDLRERWPDMTPAERREALALYGVARVVVHGPTPAEWELMFR